jgi:hypothetical protein
MPSVTAPEQFAARRFVTELNRHAGPGTATSLSPAQIGEQAIAWSADQWAQAAAVLGLTAPSEDVVALVIDELGTVAALDALFA